MNDISFYHTGENALTIRFGDEIDEAINARVHLLYQALNKNPIPFCVDVIPAYSTLTLVYDVVQIRKQHPSAFQWVQKQAEQILDACDWSGKQPSRKLKIPVCYDLTFAPDSKALSARKKITVEKLVELHVNKTYRVYMIGFLPGFAYMGRVDRKITAPRLSKPRLHVAQGSVGIAGDQTGIYPVDSPGGWNIIGKTALKLFDPTSMESPVLFQPGDEVNFFPVSREEFLNFDSSFEIIQP